MCFSVANCLLLLYSSSLWLALSVIFAKICFTLNLYSFFPCVSLGSLFEVLVVTPLPSSVAASLLPLCILPPLSLFISYEFPFLLCIYTCFSQILSIFVPFHHLYSWSLPGSPFPYLPLTPIRNFPCFLGEQEDQGEPLVSFCASYRSGPADKKLLLQEKSWSSVAVECLFRSWRV